MSNKEIALWFDKAYAYISAGDFDAATAAFEYVISNFEPYAASIAEQRLRWYCVPLKAVFDRVQESQTPVNIYEALAEVFRVHDSALEARLQLTFQEVERGLSSISACVCVGKKYWIRRDIFDELIQNAIRDIQHDSGLVPLTDLIKEKWFDSSTVEPDLPDHVTQSIFADKLAKHEIHVLAHGQCFISDLGVSTVVESFYNFLCNFQKPARLKEFLADHFSTTIYLNELEIFFKGCLDARFIEVSPGFDFLVELIRLETNSFDSYFQEHLQPLSTSAFLTKILFPNWDQPLKLSPKFIKFAAKRLSRNPGLRHFADDQWIATSQIDQLVSKILAYLSQQKKALLMKEIVQNGLSFNLGSTENLTLLVSLLESEFRRSQMLIDIGNSRWLHQNALQGTCDQAYHYLRDSKEPLSTSSLIQFVFKIDRGQSSKSFLAMFEKMLSGDGRFSSQIIHGVTYWKSIDASRPYYEQFYQILLQRHIPLTVTQLILMMPEGTQIEPSKVNLSLDERFISFPADRWGLSQWVWLNDLVFDYIAKTRRYHHANVIVGLVCQANGISEQNAIFIPEEDSRFVKDSINRWGIIYRLTDNELNRIHAALIKYMGLGCSIENILLHATQLPAYMTDVEELLSNDNRFICLDDKWFARQSAFYEVSQSNLDFIYDFLSSLPADKIPISISDLIHKSLGRDARLTNAEEQLQLDDRFQEVSEGFWVLTGFKFPDIDRNYQPIGGIHRRSEIALLNLGEDIQLPTEFTLRKGVQRIAKSTLLTPIKKAYITLLHLDVLHGNLRISGPLRQMIPDGSTAVHFKDDQDYEFLCPLDETCAILHIHDWLKKRGLTFGDKISIQQGDKTGVLFIRPYGERDQRVYQEAVQHQDIERLIEEARRVGKSYHDLIIEVMEALPMALHREDIFQLVDYHRTASRNTIFEILSLVDCPYEELRYFVPEGRGNWSFSKKRKEAYDMKMQELVQQNLALTDQNAMLTERLDPQQETSEHSKLDQLTLQLHSLEETILQLEIERAQFAQSNENFRAELDGLEKTFIERFSARLELSQSQNRELNERFAALDAQNTELKGLVNGLKSGKTELQELLDQSQKNEENWKAQLETLQSELSIKKTANADLRAHIVSLTINLEEQQKTIQAFRSEHNRQLKELRDHLQNCMVDLENARNELGSTRFQAEQQVIASRVQVNELQSKLNTVQTALLATNNDYQAELTKLQGHVDQINRALRTPLGRLFFHIFRISANNSQKEAL